MTRLAAATGLLRPANRRVLAVAVVAGLGIAAPGQATAQILRTFLRQTPAAAEAAPDAASRPAGRAAMRAARDRDPDGEEAPDAFSRSGLLRPTGDDGPDAGAPRARPPRRVVRPADDVVEGLVGACAGGVFFGVVSAATALTAVAASSGPMLVLASSALMTLPVVATAAVSAGALGCGLSMASAMVSSAAVSFYRRSRDGELEP